MEYITFIGMGIIVALVITYLVGFWHGAKHLLKRIDPKKKLNLFD